MATETNPNRRHVTPHTDGGWQVIAPGASRASELFGTQKEAIDRAREILQNSGGGELTIHGTDGQIRESDTVAPGSDPRSSQDAK